MSNLNLPDLPVELIHRILDFLSSSFILGSFRSICSRLRTTVDTYDRFELDFGSLQNSDVQLFSRFVQLANVISLKFSTGYHGKSQCSQLFFSYFDTRQFTRLRSISFSKIRAAEIRRFFEQISSTNLVSLTMDVYDRDSDDVLAIICPVITRSMIRKLYINNLDYINPTVSWPIQSTLEQLTIQDCTLVNIVLFFAIHSN
ncbi:unnamed protein product [Rotaria magnacalcarata]|uniref:F-box domain-containing protein n=1 Tax=Rotaria magnacalcarata TaxID=392030 RepID=A0A816P7P7_9BILA|nr:unnamed protein product [Rotaria magnacalcarata]CAF2045586.1 unnamed protein product [Rotaria magnacalcarata]